MNIYKFFRYKVPNYTRITTDFSYTHYYELNLDEIKKRFEFNNLPFHIFYLEVDTVTDFGFLLNNELYCHSYNVEIYL